MKPKDINSFIDTVECKLPVSYVTHEQRSKNMMFMWECEGRRFKTFHPITRSCSRGAANAVSDVRKALSKAKG